MDKVLFWFKTYKILFYFLISLNMFSKSDLLNFFFEESGDLKVSSNFQSSFLFVIKLNIIFLSTTESQLGPLLVYRLNIA